MFEFGGQLGGDGGEHFLEPSAGVEVEHDRKGRVASGPGGDEGAEAFHGGKGGAEMGGRGLGGIQYPLPGQQPPLPITRGFHQGAEFDQVPGAFCRAVGVGIEAWIAVGDRGGGLGRPGLNPARRLAVHRGVFRGLGGQGHLRTGQRGFGKLASDGEAFCRGRREEVETACQAPPQAEGEGDGDEDGKWQRDAHGRSLAQAAAAEKSKPPGAGENRRRRTVGS